MINLIKQLLDNGHSSNSNTNSPTILSTY